MTDANKKEFNFKGLEELKPESIRENVKSEGLEGQGSKQFEGEIENGETPQPSKSPDGVEKPTYYKEGQVANPINRIAKTEKKVSPVQVEGRPVNVKDYVEAAAKLAAEQINKGVDDVHSAGVEAEKLFNADSPDSQKKA